MEVQLLVVQGKPRGKSLLFRTGDFLFGRGPECHVRPNCDVISRQHCLLRVTERGLFVRDLGSTNGTLVNGTRVLAEAALQLGDLLQLGPLVLKVTQYQNHLLQTACVSETVDVSPLDVRRADGSREDALFAAPTYSDTVEHDDRG